jgi:anti-anti-sigma factor
MAVRRARARRDRRTVGALPDRASAESRAASIGRLLPGLPLSFLACGASAPEMLAMQVKMVSHAGDVMHLQAEGKIGQQDLANGEEPIAALLGPDTYSRRVLLSLERSDHVDSLGVRWLLNCHKRFREAGGLLVIHSVPPLIMQVLKVMKLDKVFHMADSESAAQARATGGAP